LRAEGGSAVLQDHWLPGFNFNVEEWFEGDRCETLAICRSLAVGRAVFACGRGKARRPVHGQELEAGSEAPPGGRLVRTHWQMNVAQPGPIFGGGRCSA